MMGGWMIIQKFWSNGFRLLPSIGTVGSNSKGLFSMINRKAKKAWVKASTATA
jgi:hypothetical protein